MNVFKIRCVEKCGEDDRINLGMCKLCKKLLESTNQVIFANRTPLQEARLLLSEVDCTTHDPLIRLINHHLICCNVNKMVMSSRERDIIKRKISNFWGSGL